MKLWQLKNGVQLAAKAKSLIEDSIFNHHFIHSPLPASYTSPPNWDIKSVGSEFFIVVYGKLTNNAWKNKLTGTPSESHFIQMIYYRQP
ncbi:MAG: hypothetical protein JWQ40_824 [Segetibacter sp.]|nr:hypothetical protein [Segetibacter sp.]